MPDARRAFLDALDTLRARGGQTPCWGKTDIYFSTRPSIQRQAAEACLHCELLDLCYESALAEEAPEPAEGLAGVRGATTPADRRRARRATAPRRTA